MHLLRWPLLIFATFNVNLATKIKVLEQFLVIEMALYNKT